MRGSQSTKFRAPVQYYYFSEYLLYIEQDGAGPRATVCVIDPNNPEATKITWPGAYPSWSPDGTKIVFAKPIEGIANVGNIFVANADGTNAINLSHSLDKVETWPKWSPDGKKIVYMSDEPSFEGETVLNLIDLAGKKTLLLAADKELLYPAWSPDGKKIAFDADGAIYLLNTDEIFTNIEVTSWGRMKAY